MRYIYLSTLLAALFTSVMSLSGTAREVADGCNLQGAIRSPASNTEAELVLSNPTNTDFFVFWVNYDGFPVNYQNQEEPLLRLEPGRRESIQSYVGHYYVILDGQRNCRTVVQVDAQYVELVAPGNNGQFAQSFPDNSSGEAYQQQLTQQNTPSSAQSAQNVPQSPNSGNIAASVMATHNLLRAGHCVPKLEWSQRLAAIAQKHANTCVFQHSQNGLGENLAIGTRGAYSVTRQIEGWYREIADYDFEAGGSNNNKPVGHFTQMIWRDSKQIGCAVATCGSNKILVCNYEPAGNISNRTIENVPKQCN